MSPACACRGMHGGGVRCHLHVHVHCIRWPHRPSPHHLSAVHDLASTPHTHLGAHHVLAPPSPTPRCTPRPPPPLCPDAHHNPAPPLPCAFLPLQALREEGYPEVRTMLCMGGIDPKEQYEQLKLGVHCAVATPGRLKDLLHKQRMTLDICRCANGTGHDAGYICRFGAGWVGDEVWHPWH